MVQRHGLQVPSHESTGVGPSPSCFRRLQLSSRLACGSPAAAFLPSESQPEDHWQLPSRDAAVVTQAQCHGHHWHHASVDSTRSPGRDLRPPAA
eukprot:2345779-Rhodomonas_salina.1